MSFHVYIEPDLQLELEALCKKIGMKRNTIVREAVREYVARRKESTWPETVLRFKSDPALPRFESLRYDLLQDREDIFSRKHK